MKKIIVFSSFLLLFIYSCKKDEGSPQQIFVYPDHHFYLQASTVPYKFGTGSYWVYTNDSTGILDSVVVDSISSGAYLLEPGVNGGPSTISEYYEMYLHSEYSLESFNYFITRENLIEMNHSGNCYDGFHGQPVYITGSNVGTTATAIEIIGTYPFMNVAGNAFTNVREVKLTASAQTDPVFLYDTYLYFKDSIGLTKKMTDLTTSGYESWSLLRWHINW